MEPHGILTLYSVKALEYLVAVAYLLAFVPFWRYLSAPPAPAAAPSPHLAGAGWFRLASDVALHPGHGWARGTGEDGTVTVGLDDFAGRLVGPLTAVCLPRPGSALAQGERGWTLVAGPVAVDMLAPVGGTVVAVNPQVEEAPGVAERDPYGAGWLLKVRPSRWPADAKQLLTGARARRWMEEAGDALRARAAPDLGVVVQDGGVPVRGIARELDPDGWPQLARELLLT
jgi:glycine cleavage system H protein